MIIEATFTARRAISVPYYLALWLLYSLELLEQVDQSPIKLTKNNREI